MLQHADNVTVGYGIRPVPDVGDAGSISRALSAILRSTLRQFENTTGYAVWTNILETYPE